MNSRRNFFKTLLAFAGLASLATISPSVFAEEKRRAKGGADDKTMVKPGEGVAAGVGYVEKSTDKTKVCGGCILYTKDSTKNGKEIGKCSLFQGQFVYAEGTCKSWAKKA